MALAIKPKTPPLAGCSRVAGNVLTGWNFAGDAGMSAGDAGMSAGDAGMSAGDAGDGGDIYPDRSKRIYMFTGNIYMFFCAYVLF